MARVLMAVTASVSAILIRGLPSGLKQGGHEVAVVSSEGPEMYELSDREGIDFFTVEMKRPPAPLSDLMALCKLIRIIRRYRPDLVNAGTPKAGFLTIIASWLCRVPVRVYTLHGFRHESLEGLTRWLQIQIEKVTVRLSTDIQCVSESVKRLGEAEAIITDSHPAVVLGHGSCGIELELYNPEKYSEESRIQIKAALGIPTDSTVIGFVGRLIPRKGIKELIQAWSSMRDSLETCYLVLVGPTEDEQPMDPETSAAIERDPRVIATGFANNVSDYMAIFDIFALPAHWEGFGNVLVEAAAMGIPVVSTRGTGTCDAVSDGYNGTLVDVKDTKGLRAALVRYIENPELRVEHGNNGVVWSRNFSREHIAALTRTYMDELIESASGPRISSSPKR